MLSFINQFDEYWDTPQGICDNCSRTYNFVGHIWVQDLISCKCSNCGVLEVVNEVHNCTSYKCAKARL